MIKKVIDINGLTKQAYMKPSMKVVELQHKCQILAGSDQFGMNNQLQIPDNEENWVEVGW